MIETMIHLTRLNSIGFWVSTDQIESIESTPDTVLTLLSGKKVLVKESPKEVIDRIIEYKRKIYFNPEVLVDKQGKDFS